MSSRSSSIRVFRDVDGASRGADVIQSALEDDPMPRDVAPARPRRCACVGRARPMARASRPLRWWRIAHEATHDHPTLGEVQLLRWFVNHPPVSTSGGRSHSPARPHPSAPGRNPFLERPWPRLIAGGGSTNSPIPDSWVFGSSRSASRATRSRATTDDLGGLWRRGDYISDCPSDPALARGGHGDHDASCPTPRRAERAVRADARSAPAARLRRLTRLSTSSTSRSTGAAAKHRKALPRGSAAGLSNEVPMNGRIG